MRERQGSGWRGAVKALHRDVGYLCFGLTIAFALTGVLLNHLHDWNPNYRMAKVARTIDPYPEPSSFAEKDVPSLLARIGETGKPTGYFRPDPGTVQLFFEGGRVLTADLSTGRVEGEVARRRPVLAWLNALHLNRSGRAWTAFSDLYAVALAFLAVSGILVLKERPGAPGRKMVLAIMGMIIPVLVALAGYSR